MRCRVNKNTNELLKVILDRLKISQQDFLETQIKEYVFNNSDILVGAIKEEKKNNVKG